MQYATFIVLKFVTSTANLPSLTLGSDTSENPGDTAAKIQITRGREPTLPLYSPSPGCDEVLG